MDQKYWSNQLAPAMTVIATAALLGGLFFVGRLQSFRPTVADSYLHGVAGLEDVSSRLWQDPFVAIRQHDEQEGEDHSSDARHALHKLVNEVKKRMTPFRDRNQPRLLLLPVMVPGGFYAENREMRRRHRIAVLSGLMRKGYVPETPDHIGYVVAHWSDTTPPRLMDDYLLAADDPESPDNPDGAAPPAEEESGGGPDESDPGEGIRREGIPFEWFGTEPIVGQREDSNSSYDNVLVLWLDEEYIDNFTSLDDLLCCLLHGVQGTSVDDTAVEEEQVKKALTEETLAVRLIGPSNSATLIRLLDETERSIDQQGEASDSAAPSPSYPHMLKAGTFRRHLRVYSSRATAPVETLQSVHSILRSLEIPEPPGGYTRREVAAGITRSLLHEDADGEPFLRFIETAVPDASLAGALLAELKRRQFRFRKDHVVLIGESDTFYGRRFVNAFRKESEAYFHEEAEERVHAFTYLRGVDGRVPGATHERRRGAEGLAGRQRPVLGGLDEEIDAPFGRSHFDSMQRMADAIHNLDRALRQRGQRIRAIGAVGSDVYDKQLVLQALRPRLPDAIFFTTDLDARLMQRNQYRWSRNLIIVSGYGLQLHHLLQGQIPPFRDGYQTSTFLATLLSLGGIEEKGSDENDPATRGRSPATLSVTNQNGEIHLSASGGSFGERPLALNGTKALPPQVYEVSRSGVYDITPNSFVKEVRLQGATTGVPVRSPLHPARLKSRWVSTLIWLLLIVFSCIVLLVAMRGQWHQQFCVPQSPPSPLARRMRRIFIIAIVLLIAFGLIVLVDHARGTGEPAAFFAGVSVWPTELLRLIVLLLCLRWFVLSIDMIEQSNERLNEELGLKARSTPTKRLRSLPTSAFAILSRWTNILLRETSKATCPRSALSRIRRSLCRVRSRVTVNFWGGKKRVDPPSAVEIWREYQRRGRLVYRLMRTIAMSFVLAAVIVSFALILRAPNIPSRGELAFWTTMIIAVASMVACGMLTLFVTDIIRLCDQFARLLAAGHTRWPRKARELVRERKLVRRDAEDLLDVLVVAKRTDVVGHIVIYPFIAIALMIIARNTYFDNWEWPFFMYVFFGVLIGYALVSAIVLRQSAEAVRRNCLERLHKRLLRALSESGTNPAARARAQQLEKLIDEIRQIRSGAFSPWSQRPLVQAMIPLGGVAALSVIEILSLFNI